MEYTKNKKYDNKLGRSMNANLRLEQSADYRNVEELTREFFEDAIYDVDEGTAAKFDKTFPHKELQDNLPSQERFRYLLGSRRPRD